MNKRILWAILSGVLLSLAWTNWGLGWILLFAFLPLLHIENELEQNKQTFKARQLFYYAALSFLVWNIISTWWVSNSTLFGGIAAILVNTFAYTMVFGLFHLVKRKMGKHTGYSALIIFWLAFERLYLDGEISWPWLILGNGFANNTILVQWYEYTGALGGSFWVLIINVMLFNWLQHLRQYKTLYGQYIFTVILLACLVLPMVLSVQIAANYQEQSHPISVSIVQPNIDPFEDKFSGMSQLEQLEKILALYQTQGNSNADFMLLPESAIDDDISENNFYQSYSTRQMLKLAHTYPQLSIIYGAMTHYTYWNGTKTETARAYRDTSLYYDVYNSAIQINTQDSLQKYHKSKLVIGVEKTPYPKIFGLFKQLAVDLGGTTGNLGYQQERTVFRNSHNLARVAPIICYESVYGEFVSAYVRNGANILAIITNDGWWGNSPGYWQHLSFAKLRAIETRRSVMRCANTGVSAIINQKGEIEAQTEYWKEAVLNGTLNLNSEQTYFVRHGDFVGRIASFFSILLLLSVGVSWLRSKKSDAQPLSKKG